MFGRFKVYTYTCICLLSYKIRNYFHIIFSILGKHMCLCDTESGICRNQVQCIYFVEQECFRYIAVCHFFMTEEHQCMCH